MSADMMGMLAGAQLWNTGEQIGQTLANYYMARKQSSKARRFTREVMQNKYQWAVGDLEKAGLSKLLAYGATPGVASAPIVGAQASAGRGTGEAINTARQVATFRSDVEAARANAAKIGMEGALAEQLVRVEREREKQVRMSTALEATGLAGAKTEEEFSETAMGRRLRWLNRIMRALRGEEQSTAR